MARYGLVALLMSVLAMAPMSLGFNLEAGAQRAPCNPAVQRCR
jgi:hypothetical protein